MSEPASRAAKPSSWAFLGGYFLFFIGWVAGFVGSIQFVDAGQFADPAEAVTLGYALVAASVGLFALGVQVLARAYWGGMSAHPEAAVIFFMTPLPAIAAVVVNLVGRYFRQSDGTFLRVLLIGGGVYLVASIVMELSTGFHLTATRDDLRAFVWPLVLQAGVAAALLGLVPPTRAEPDPLPEALPLD